MRKTKIIATLGPACDSEEVLERLLNAGADGLRFNFSHGTHQQHLIAYHRARALAEKMGKTIALIQDLQGPKIRVGALEGDQAVLEPGAELVLTSRRIKGDNQRIPVVYDNLEQEVKPEEIILMDDGKLRLRSLEVSPDGVRCRVLEGGVLVPHKGVNLPGTALSLPSLTPKDIEDLRFGIQTGFDAVALSFVARAEDVVALRNEMVKLGTTRPIIAKLERAACLENIPAILDACDGVMVARGDLGVEVDIKRVPVLQKTIISQANKRGVPVITATQMLESMTRGLLPTRAEAADVANAVFDGTDVLMLSGETAVGKYPVQAVQMMADIAVEAEQALDERQFDLWRKQDLKPRDVSEAICHTAVVAAHDLGLRNIVAVTRSGRTALDIAKFRPGADIHAFSFDRETSNVLALSRGVVPHLCKHTGSVESLMDLVDARLLEEGIAQKGEAVAMVLGMPIGKPKSTSTLMVHKVGEKEPVGKEAAGG